MVKIYLEFICCSLFTLAVGEVAVSHSQNMVCVSHATLIYGCHFKYKSARLLL